MRYSPAACRRWTAFLFLLVMAASVLACQSTISNVKTLLERSGTGSAKLPTFTSRGTYDIAYSYSACTGGVTGMIITERVGSDPTPTTLLQTASVETSGSVAGRKPGVITLEIQSHCTWKITVTG